MPNIKYLPQAERLLSGQTSAQLTDSATEIEVSNPPDPEKLPTMVEFEPDSSESRELTRWVKVNGSIVTIERGINNGGVGFPHASQSPYKQKITSRHWDAVVESIEQGYLMEDAIRTLTRVDADTFEISGYGAGDDLTAYYTQGRILRFNSSDSDTAIALSSSYNAGTNKTTVEIASGTVPDPLTTVELGIFPKGATDKFLTSASPEITTPKITTSINDSNGNEAIKIPATASAVNEVTITNAATGNSPTIEATGDDANIDFVIKGKGTGVLKKVTSVSIQVVDGGSDVETGDGKAYITIPPELNGMKLTAVHARVVTAGTTNTTDIQIHNVTDTADILSTKLTIDSGETGSDTAAAAVIDTDHDDVSTNDLLRIDIDAVSTTKPKGLVVRLTFGF